MLLSWLVSPTNQQFWGRLKMVGLADQPTTGGSCVRIRPPPEACAGRGNRLNVLISGQARHRLPQRIALPRLSWTLAQPNKPMLTYEGSNVATLMKAMEDI